VTLLLFSFFAVCAGCVVWGWGWGGRYKADIILGKIFRNYEAPLTLLISTPTPSVQVAGTRMS